MTVFEYKHLKGSPCYVLELLNETANEGWEVCGFSVSTDGHYHVIVRKPNG